jgi:methylenetetrahydrofolate dehydrogenase (NADP+) / methenyltetrahydrofolate cyclohydrolase
MTARIIDGRAIAASLRKTVASETAELAKSGHVPGLAVVLVGDDPASEIYVRSKVRMTREVGMNSFERRLPATTTQDELIAVISALNADPRVDGILVQLPLPRHIAVEAVIAALDPAKDVDGFHPLNVGNLALGLPGVVPCTPLGCLKLIRTVIEDCTGQNAVVLGRSNIVGKPMAQLLLAQNCTVTAGHSRTRDLAGLCRTADILVTAVGQPGLVRGDWIKPGAVVIDVGINRLPTGGLVGDVAFEEAQTVAGAITPVPGGVGPMTIACLLSNTVTAARRGFERRRSGSPQQMAK